MNTSETQFPQVRQGRFNGIRNLGRVRAWHNSLDHLHGCLKQNAIGLAILITQDFSVYRVRGARANSRRAQGHCIGPGDMQRFSGQVDRVIGGDTVARLADSSAPI